MNRSVKSDEELLALLERTMQTVAHRAPDMDFSTTAGSPRWMASAAASTVLVVGVGAAGLALSSRHDAHSPLSPGAENSVPVDTGEPGLAPTMTTVIGLSPVAIPAGSVVCVVAGASQRAATLCADELGGAVIGAGSISAESFVMSVDPTNPSHVAATANVSEALNLPVRALDVSLLPTGRTASLNETTYLVLGTTDVPYAP